MKRIVYLAVAMLMPMLLLAAPVKKDAAKAIASAFLKKQLNADGKMRAPQQLSLVSNSPEDAAYYVFNNASGDGFVMVAGDDAIGDVIGYSDQGSFDEANMPEALRAILNDYSKVVKFAHENNLPMHKAPRKAARADVAPFMEFEWNQSAPYCNQAPATSGKDHASLGCMAVTTSMIVAHYKYPETLPAAYNGTYTNPATKYSYEKFKKSYSSSLDSIDYFMYHIANLLGTNYSSSSAQESQLLPTLKNTLGFNPYMRTLRRDAYSAEDWEELIYNELAAGRPVNFIGSHEDLGGHSYITDGYQASDGFFHMIWGWGNTCVGYFDINILNPFIVYISQWGGMGYNCPPAGFTQDLKAVVGIQPEPTEKVASLLTVDNITKNGSNVYRAMFFNYNAEAYNGQIGWAILGEGENFTLLENVPTTTVTRVTSYTHTDLSTDNLNLSDGVYKIVPVCKTDAETEWNLCQGYKQKYVELVIADGEKTVIAHPVLDLHVNGLVYQRVTGEYIEMVLDINNTGDDTFGSLHITGVRDDGKKVDGSHMDIAVSAGKNQLLSVFIAHGGNYSGHIYDVTVEYMKKKIWTGKIDPNIERDYLNRNYSTYKNVNFEDYEYVDGNAMLYSTTLKGEVVVEASRYHQHYMPVRFTLKDENDNIVYQQAQQIYIPEGETRSYPICIEGLKANKTYKLSAEVLKVTRSYSSYSETPVGANDYFKDFPINLRVGIPYYKEDGSLAREIITEETTQPVSLPETSAAVDLTKFSADMVDLSSITNPNCIYFLKADAEVPASINGKNVVKGNEAEKITLVDGYPIAIPADFTAQEATYTRTFTKGNNGNDQGWTTIVVPFDAKATVDGQNVDWFRSKSESGRKFWLYKYNGGVGGTVYFDYETGNVIKGNEPYLIAVPGNKWGPTYDLRKEFVFKGTNVAFSKDAPALEKDDYTFVGLYGKKELTDHISYKMNEAGDFFELVATEGVYEMPFHAYFSVLGAETANKAMLRIVQGENPNPTGIEQVETLDDINNAVIYNLNGQRVARPVVGGIYIVNGKKVVIK